MSFFDQASLVMIPSGYKTSKAYSVKPTDGSGDMAFSRSNDTATRVNSAGLIEKVRTNLVLQSNTFTNASWAKVNATVSAGAVIGPDGTLSGSTITYSSGGYLNQEVNYGQLTFITASIFAKAGSLSTIRIREAYYYGSQTIFDLSNGTVVSGNGKIESAGNGWYRISISQAYTTGQTFAGFIYDTTSAGSVSIYGAQYEVSDFGPTDYIATTSAAVSVGPVANVPRLDYLNSSCPRLLLEPQRTNLVTYSEQFNNTGNWYTANTTVSANIATSPDGTQNADRLATTAANGYLSNAVAISISADASIYTQSIFVKWVSGSEVIKLRSALTGGTAVAKESSINIRTGVIVSTDTTAQVVSYGSGWYRISHQITNNSTNTNAVYQFYPTNDGTNTNVIYLWGAQLEAGAYATSYIPTLGSASTRGSDSCSKTGISSLIGQTEGTVFVEYKKTHAVEAGGQILILLADNANPLATRLQITLENDNTFLYVLNGFSTLAQSSNVAIPNGTNKIAFSYGPNGYKFYVNGVQQFSNTITTVPATQNIFVGNFTSSSGYLSDAIAQSLLFKTQLTNAQLAELTTI